MSIWVAVVAAGILCFGLRISMVAFLGRVDLPDRVALALRYVAPATMSALLVTTMMTGPPRRASVMTACTSAWASGSTSSKGRTAAICLGA